MLIFFLIEVFNPSIFILNLSHCRMLQKHTSYTSNRGPVSSPFEVMTNLMLIAERETGPKVQSIFISSDFISYPAIVPCIRSAADFWGQMRYISETRSLEAIYWVPASALLRLIQQQLFLSKQSISQIFLAHCRKKKRAAQWWTSFWDQGHGAACQTELPRGQN